MSEYFSEQLGQDLDRHQQKVMSDRRFYGPALNFLQKTDQEFRTQDLVDSVSANSISSRLDEYRAGCLLGALREEYGLIDGSLEGGKLLLGSWTKGKWRLGRCQTGAK